MRSAQNVSASSKLLRRLAWAAAVGCLAITGCKSFLDQSELVRDKSDRLVVQILPSIDPIDEPETEFSAAQEVTPQDLKVMAADYLVGPNDLISVAIFDLTAGGVETVRTARVSETGMLSLPMVGEPVKASGLTELQLQRAIAQRYKEAGILERAQVSVTVVEARGRTFNILGAVGRPGQYPMVEADFRVLNALVAAGDTTSTLIDYLYIIRKTRSEQPAASTAPGATEGTGPANLAPATRPSEPVDLAPRSEATAFARPILALAQDPIAPLPTTRPAAAPRSAVPGFTPPDEERTVVIEGQPRRLGTTRPAGAAPAANTAAPRNGAPTPTPNVAPVAPVAPAPAPVTQPQYEFGSTLAADDAQRIIKVPLRELKNGDLRYNVVIRPGDTIVVPMLAQGFYYVGGHVGAPGVYSLAGQKITLKQAIVGARMLDGMAVPQRTDVIRRIGDNELFVRMNLAKVVEGRQPDIYLKANDVVLVGTDFYTPFLAAVRGAFRFTYGFGFLYDRNYAPQQEQQIKSN